MSLITSDILKTYLKYDALSGEFTRILSKRSDRIGKPAGTINTDGYVVISIESRPYYAHRLAWLYMTGAWPSLEIDHMDGNRSNNSWSNLRIAKHSQNATNSRMRRNNTSGAKGVSFYKPYNKWRAYITHKGKHIGLGYFNTVEEASKAYQSASIEYHGEFRSIL